MLTFNFHSHKIIKKGAIIKRFTILFVLMIYLIPCINLEADSINNLSFGYSANVPQEIIGFNFFMIPPKSIGFYLDLKTDITSLKTTGDNYYDNITIGQAEGWGDELLQEDKGYMSINVGATKMLTSRLAAYIGTGLTIVSKYRQYYDSTHILGYDGEYWISGGDTEYGINGLGGIIFVLPSDFFIQLGGEINPSGATLGFGKVL